MFDLSGKSALVTGASGGIGGAIAAALHAQGATVALSGTRREALEKAAVSKGNTLLRLPRRQASVPGSPSRSAASSCAS